MSSVQAFEAFCLPKCESPFNVRQALRAQAVVTVLFIRLQSIDILHNGTLDILLRGPGQIVEGCGQ